MALARQLEKMMHQCYRIPELERIENEQMAKSHIKDARVLKLQQDNYKVEKELREYQMFNREIAINKDINDDLKYLNDVLLADCAKYFDLASKKVAEFKEEDAEEFNVEFSRQAQFFKKQQEEARENQNEVSAIKIKAQSVRGILIKAHQITDSILNGENKPEEQYARKLDDLIKGGADCAFIKRLEEIRDRQNDEQVPKSQLVAVQTELNQMKASAESHKQKLKKAERERDEFGVSLQAISSELESKNVVIQNATAYRTTKSVKTMSFSSSSSYTKTVVQN